MESIARNVQTYMRTNWHFTTLSTLNDYELIKVYENHGKIFTDGYRSTQVKERRLLQIAKMPNYVYLKQRWNSIRHAWISWKPKQSYSPPSQLFFKISEKCDDPNLQSFAQELSTPDPSLQKNLGIITESTNLKFLATSIEMHETIAMSDASVRSRQRAAHSYILTTKMWSRQNQRHGSCRL